MRFLKFKSEFCYFNAELSHNPKTESDALFSELGLDTSTAIRVFIKQALKKRAIPFSIKAKSKEEEEAFYSPENVAILKSRYERTQKGQGLTNRDIIDV